ncbi:XRE family transcriptional regulator [Saccharothrix coeruleofusca]|nr:XRE family transcriptional regulator [Saccharothrix coeruleofusca]MBP2337196.1 transcriptional regulator with XRE-family HTH domain/DNA-binding transcriptional ArsR family regulator [Saccharothrix coeruleofusca]
MPAFGQALLGHRRAAGLSQADLARATGMSVRALRELERGRAKSAQQRSVALLAEALALSGGERELFLALAEQGRRRRNRPVDPAVLHSLPLVTDLVGRERELRELNELSARSSTGVVVVTGPPGVGKTALAVAAAHQLVRNFPDGCLAIDLNGVGDRPVAPREALRRLLVALEVPGDRVPEGEDERAELFGVLLRERRVLVLLDNALDEAQVRPLLGAGPGGMTLVTCRRALSGLTAAHRMTLVPLTPASAVEVLASALGEDVRRTAPEAALELVSCCGNLPLAVRIAGNRLATRPHCSLAHFAEQLRDEEVRLNSLSAGDRQVRSAFEVSYRRLSPSARRVFRRLAAIPGDGFDAELAAAATGVPPSQVGAPLDELVEVSLLYRVPEGRFRFHELIRLYAAEVLVDVEPVRTREELRDALLAQFGQRDRDESGAAPDTGAGTIGDDRGRALPHVGRGMELTRLCRGGANPVAGVPEARTRAVLSPARSADTRRPGGAGGVAGLLSC